jgi:hypothetical protein
MTFGKRVTFSTLYELMLTLIYVSANFTFSSVLIFLKQNLNRSRQDFVFVFYISIMVHVSWSIILLLFGFSLLRYLIRFSILKMKY